MVEPVEVNDLDVIAVCPLDDQPLIEARADQEQPCLDRTGAELVPRLDETIEMTSDDPLACLGFADHGDASGCRFAICHDSGVRPCGQPVGSEPENVEFGPQMGLEDRTRSARWEGLEPPAA